VATTIGRRATARCGRMVPVLGAQKAPRSKFRPILLLLGLSSSYIFWHIFFLQIRLLRRRFLVAMISLFLEPKVKALQLARRLRDADGDEV
jgi:hypothetical protein